MFNEKFTLYFHNFFVVKIVFLDGKTSYTDYIVPTNDSYIVSGSCGDGTSDQNISIQWSDKNLNNTMDLLFKFYPETKLYSLNAITFDINAAILPNGSAQMSKYLYVGDDFWAPTGWSFHCNKWQTVELSSENRRYLMGTLNLTNIQFEASLTGNIEAFSEPVECRVDDLTTSMCMRVRACDAINSVEWKHSSEISVESVENKNHRTVYT